MSVAEQMLMFASHSSENSLSRMGEGQGEGDEEDQILTIMRLTTCMLLALLAGCSAAFRQSSKTSLEFLEYGKTTKAMVLLKLGPPTGAFEGERILSYRLGKRKEGYFVLEQIPGPFVLVGSNAELRGIFHLVLVFDEHGVLQKHSLIQISLPSRQASKTWLDFLEDGKTTKEIVLLKLGQPANVLVGETIFTHQLAKTTDGYFVLEQSPDELVLKRGHTDTWGDDLNAWLIEGIEGKFHLVLAFDEHNILQQHSLLQTGSLRQTSKTWLDFLENGKITKDMVILKLGPSFTTFDKEQIISYRLVKMRDGYFALERVSRRTHLNLRPGKGEKENFLVLEEVPDESVPTRSAGIFGIEGMFDLVLVFDGNDVLQQYSLVPLD